MRTIEHPGVEIKEIDKSGYAKTPTGSKCFVMGYSDKGEVYQPMEFTSKAAFELYYGDPDNEAERYFYNAASEVINQNGVLYCARLPYDNKAYEKMTAFKFKVSSNTLNTPTAGEYLKQEGGIKTWIEHDDDFEKDALDYVIQNKCYREIDGNLENGLEQETEIRTFFNKVIEKYNTTYNKIYSNKRWSIDYYKVDKEKSEKLQKRFLSYLEAVDYLEELADGSVKQKYIYWWDKDKSIIRDDGDWIAVPLYAEYYKETLAVDGYSPSSGEIEYIGDIPRVLWGIVRDNSLVDEIHEHCGIMELEDITTIGDCLTVLEYLNGKEETRKITEIGDFIEAIKLCYEQKKDEEIRTRAYASWRTNTLSETTDTITYYVGVGVSRIEQTLPINEYISCNYYDDGANNEYIFNTVVSSLWEDKTLELSVTKDNMVDYEISNLYENELWVPYKSRSLSSIIRENSKKDSEYIKSWGDMINIFKDESGIKYSDIIEKYGAERGDFKDRINFEVPYNAVVDGDLKLRNYLKISSSQYPIKLNLSEVDEYRTGESKVGPNTFWVVDKTGLTLNKISEDDRKAEKRECIGIFPVITTAANALYAQDMINVDVDSVHHYETVTSLRTKLYNDDDVTSYNEFRVSSDLVMPFSQNDRTHDQIDNKELIDTVSRDANNYFLPIQGNAAGDGFEKDNMKKIGVVVYKAFLDASEGNKVSFQAVESFCGSLNRSDKNPNTGVSEFIDDIVNTQSDYIYFFSNCFFSTATKKTYNNTDILICEPGRSGMLGWFSDETKEEISLPKLYQGIDKCFKKVEDINERDIDIIPDAGLANIAQYLKSVYGDSNPHAYDIDVTDESGNPLIKKWTCKSASDVNAWKTVEFKFDNFCKNVRKDCMFIADGPRPMVIQGQKKIVRSSKPTNTVDANILPYIKYATGLNTDYGTGYLVWFKVTDEFTGDEFWCPPSIKAMGSYINTDVNSNYWDAPAGLNRGKVQALDVAFSPTGKQADSIYTKNWNYAINYPYDGIVLEGQKTFQVKPSAFDRVNVRRLFLRLERQTFQVAKYFCYEGNTAYTRQRLVDTLDPIFYNVKCGGGIYDYKIICNDSNNTPNVIDNNELKVSIGIKPVKTAEFIQINFVALSTGGSWSEM